MGEGLSCLLHNESQEIAAVTQQGEPASQERERSLKSADDTLTRDAITAARASPQETFLSSAVGPSPPLPSPLFHFLLCKHKAASSSHDAAAAVCLLGLLVEELALLREVIALLHQVL